MIFLISAADTLGMSEHGATLGANDQPRFTTNNRDFTTKKTWLRINFSNT